MFEELYEPLPDVEAYLERIGIPCVKQPSVEYLDELIYAHQHAVPFENLDVYEKDAVPSLGKADLFDKVVRRRRGGYCFELNGLFFALLAALGFDVQASMGRVTLRQERYSLISHRANMVHIDNADYLVDVGFGGPMPGSAVKLEDGFALVEQGQMLRICAIDRNWWNVRFTSRSEDEKTVLQISTVPSPEQDFVALSYYQSQNPQSVFRLNRMANIKTETGAHDPRNATYTLFDGCQRTVRELAGDEEVNRLLAQTFGISEAR